MKRGSVLGLVAAILGAPALLAQAPRPEPAAPDVHFVTGMIPHHAQAVTMAGWAPTHGASAALRRFAERIVVAQRDEIAMMRTWLGTQGVPVPAADATHMMMERDGMSHAMLMPGMLSDEEMAQLDAARDTAFDRLFLRFMIRHHQGAITMVEELFASHGAAQDEFVFRLASDVFADQTTEIEFLQILLDDLPAPGE